MNNNTVNQKNQQINDNINFRPFQGNAVTIGWFIYIFNIYGLRISCSFKRHRQINIELLDREADAISAEDDWGSLEKVDE